MWPLAFARHNSTNQVVFVGGRAGPRLCRDFQVAAAASSPDQARRDNAGALRHSKTLCNGPKSTKHVAASVAIGQRSSEVYYWRCTDLFRGSPVPGAFFSNSLTELADDRLASWHHWATSVWWAVSTIGLLRCHQVDRLEGRFDGLSSSSLASLTQFVGVLACNYATSSIHNSSAPSSAWVEGADLMSQKKAEVNAPSSTSNDAVIDSLRYARIQSL